MPTREEYDQYFNRYIPGELNEYANMERMQNDYEKVRTRNLQLSVPASIQEKARAEAMVAEMRRQSPDFVRNYAKKIQDSQAKGKPVKLPTFDNQEVPISDISFVLAESLQRLYSSEDPRAEYYDWVQVQRRIEVDINTNGTTEDEIKARNGFIDFLDDRETELKLIISLYNTAERNGTGYYKEMAQNKLSFLHFKLSELRRLRDRTQATKSKSDEQERAEKELERNTRIMVGGLAAASLAEEQLLAREKYLHNNVVGKEFETAVEGVHAHYRPETHTAMEVMAKKERLRQNEHNMRAMLTAYRMGKSKEEFENQDVLAERKALVRRARSFSLSRYRELESQHERSA